MANIETTTEERRNQTNGRRYNTDSGRPKYYTAVPKKIEALFILLCDQGLPTGVPLTEGEIEMNILTRDLPDKEKRALVKFWPTWNAYLRKVEDYKELRQVSLQVIGQTKRQVKETRKLHGIDDMSLSDRLNITATIFKEEVVNAALELVKTPHDNATTDPAVGALYKLRVQRAKDLLSIARSLMDLGAKQEAVEVNGVVEYRLNDETQDLLANARATLIEHGIVDDRA